MELKEMYEEMGRTWKEFRDTLGKQDGEIKKHGEATAETKTLLQTLNGKMDDIEKRIGGMEAKANRPGFAQPDLKTPTEAKAAFLKWARTGELTPDEKKFLQPAEQKSLAVGTATAAGYLAPVEYVREILKGVIEFSPLRQVARVMPTSSKSIQVPKRTGVFAAVWVAEQGTRSETTGLTFGLEEIPCHEMYALVDVSFQQLEDSAFDLESVLNEEFSEQFGVAEGTAFVSGSGVGRPEGVLSNAAVVAATATSATQAVLVGDDLIDAFYGLKDNYARNATWFLRRATIGIIRKLKATTGDYVWQPGLSADKPPTILGQPYLESIDMPVVAASSKSVLVGDFRRGYMIADRIDIAVVRDPFTQAAAGNIRFHARKRVGGQVVNAEAIKLLTIHV